MWPANARSASLLLEYPIPPLERFAPDQLPVHRLGYFSEIIFAMCSSCNGIELSFSDSRFIGGGLGVGFSFGFVYRLASDPEGVTGKGENASRISCAL